MSSDRISKCVGVATRLATSAKYPEKNGGATPGVLGSARCAVIASKPDVAYGLVE